MINLLGEYFQNIYWIKPYREGSSIGSGLWSIDAHIYGSVTFNNVPLEDPSDI